MRHSLAADPGDEMEFADEERRELTCGWVVETECGPADLNEELRAWLQESHDVVGMQSDIAERRGRAPKRIIAKDADGTILHTMSPRGASDEDRTSATDVLN